MNTNKRFLFAILISLGCVLGLRAQESAPAGDVVDSLETTETAVAPTEIPDSAPRLTDIDRLFGDPSDVEAEGEDEEARGTLENVLSSPLDQEASLESTDLMTVDYPSEEIRTVLRNVADLYMLNLVVPDTLQGNTSIKLRDVTWRQIFSVVLDPVGYTFVEEGSIIKIVSKEALNFEPPVTEIFMINYADAASISGTVSNLVDPTKGGKVQVDKRTNALIVSERASMMEDIRMVVERLDKPTQQVFIETRFIEVTDTDVKNIGLNWSSLRSVGVRAGPFNSSYGETFNRNNSDNFSNESSDQTNIGEVAFENGDSSMNGVGTSRGRLINNLTGNTVIDSTSIGESNVITGAINRLGSLVDTRGINKNHSAVFSADQFGFVLSALKEQGGSKLVSNPTVVTLNNQEAMISIGEQFPIPAYQYNEETGGFEVSGFDYKDIGVILKVTPSVNHTGLITLKVEPEVSSRISERNFGGAGNASVPIIATRRTTTQIALKDGFTMGIGGLMESTGIDNSNNVPVLGKVPGLKKLFSHKSTEDTKRNLLIFITARILPSEEADFEDVFSQEMMSDVGVDPVTLRNR